MPKYDVAIIGSGLGGLLCGTILSKEGYNVIILEKNSQTGGCLQSYRRDGHTFDTGIHYIGSLDDGQILDRYFKYFGIRDKLSLKRMDEQAFDIIRKRESFQATTGWWRATGTRRIGYVIARCFQPDF